MFVTAIVLAAGKGERLKSKTPKPLVRINAKPVVIYCLQTLSSCPEIKDIIVVANSKNKRELIVQIKRYGIKKVRNLVLGGRRRQDSVRQGLEAIDNRTDLVLIHDAVRPFIDKETVSGLIKAAKKSAAVILGVPVKATIKKVDESQVVEKTLNRNSLWEAQTPQVFRKSLIRQAYRKCQDTEASDDATLVEKIGSKIKIIPGSYNNIKITTPEDLILAEAIAKGL